VLHALVERRGLGRDLGRVGEAPAGGGVESAPGPVDGARVAASASQRSSIMRAMFGLHNVWAFISSEHM
jgi:hypothetical protein